MPNYTNALRTASKGITRKVNGFTLPPGIAFLAKHPPRATQTATRASFANFTRNAPKATQTAGPLAKRVSKGVLSWFK